MSSNEKKISLQDSFLKKVKGDKKAVTFYLMNGVPIEGKVKGYDNFTIIVEEKKTGKDALIYKHAISTIKE